MTSERGFTLIEMILTVAIISMLVGISMPIYRSFQLRNDLDLTTQSIAEMLRRAQIYAGGVKGDGQWGVRLANGSAILFKGTSYATRDTNFDETTTISPGVSVGGLSDILFSKLVATPNTAGNITLTDNNINDTRTITINAKGMVSY